MRFHLKRLWGTWGLFWHDSLEQLIQCWEDLNCAVGRHYPEKRQQRYTDYVTGVLTTITYEGCKNCGGINLEDLHVR